MMLPFRTSPNGSFLQNQQASNALIMGSLLTSSTYIHVRCSCLDVN
jgi:hypothetical protein